MISESSTLGIRKLKYKDAQKGNYSHYSLSILQSHSSECRTDYIIAGIFCLHVATYNNYYVPKNLCSLFIEMVALITTILRIPDYLQWHMLGNGQQFVV